MSRIHIRVTRHSAFYSPLIMTLAGGYLRAEGLEPSYDVVTPMLTVADGIRDGTVQVAQSAPATAALEASFFPAINRQVLTRAIADYQRLGCWAAAVDISRASYETLLDVFEFNRLIRNRHPYEQAVAPLPA